MKRPLLVGLALALTAVLAAGQETTVRGSVKVGKKAARGVQVGAFWSFDGGRPAALTGGETDRRGQFSFVDEVYGPVALLALDLEAGLGGVAIREEDLQSFELELTPLSRVHGQIRSPGLGYTPEWTNVYVYQRLDGKRGRFARCSSSEAEFSFLLPDGSYELNLYGTDIQSRGLKVEVAGEDVDMGTVDIAPTVLAGLYGKPAPELTVSEARGVDPGVQLADYRGRFVVLEFWGYW